eukprot:3933238-Rhodomonas_salina.8
MTSVPGIRTSRPVAPNCTGRPEPDIAQHVRRPILVQPEIQLKKPHSQYNLYQECGFLYWISGCRLTGSSQKHVRAQWWCTAGTCTVNPGSAIYHVSTR